jgi:light-harvesting complex 1 alpha chain
MWRIWKLLDPVRALVAQAVFLAGLAVLIHLLLLSTPTFNWLDGPASRATKAQKTAAVVVEPTIVAEVKQ